MFLPDSSINPFSFSYPNQTMLKQPNTNETNPNPNPNPPSFLFPFSTSLLTPNNDSIETHFVSRSLDNFDTLNGTKEKPLRTRRKRKIEYAENPNPNSNPRKRMGKSDRHSKIYTAQGPRDRRMRLSVHIARKFFDLQDMLGFDKASKTIEWLFLQSRDAISEVAFKSDLQMNIDRSTISNCGNSWEDGLELGEKIDGELGKTGQVSQAKESRDKARARARERTREKSVGDGTFEVNPTNFEDVGFFGHHNQEIHFPIQEVGMIENYIGASLSTSNPIFDFDKDFTMSGGFDSSNCFMGMYGNWEIAVPLTSNVVQERNPNSDSSYYPLHSTFP